MQRCQQCSAAVQAQARTSASQCLLVDPRRGSRSRTRVTVPTGQCDALPLCHASLDLHPAAVVLAFVRRLPPLRRMRFDDGAAHIVPELPLLDPSEPAVHAHHWQRGRASAICNSAELLQRRRASGVCNGRAFGICNGAAIA